MDRLQTTFKMVTNRLEFRTAWSMISEFIIEKLSDKDLNKPLMWTNYFTMGISGKVAVEI